MLVGVRIALTVALGVSALAVVGAMGALAYDYWTARARERARSVLIGAGGAVVLALAAALEFLLWSV